jgi:hypothetical protein
MNYKIIVLIVSLFILIENGNCKSIGQISHDTTSDTTYAFIVAGHAYGSHTGTNLGLYTPLLNSLDGGYDPAVEFIVLTGDIVRTRLIILRIHA